MYSEAYCNAIEEAVLRHVELAKLEHPKNRELKLLQNWLKRPDYGGVYLTGEDRDIWKEPNLQDLFAVLPRGDDSPLYSFITGQVLYVYHRLIGGHIRVCWIDPMRISLTDSETRASGRKLTHKMVIIWRITLRIG